MANHGRPDPPKSQRLALECPRRVLTLRSKTLDRQPVSIKFSQVNKCSTLITERVYYRLILISKDCRLNSLLDPGIFEYMQEPLAPLCSVSVEDVPLPHTAENLLRVICAQEAFWVFPMEEDMILIRDGTRIPLPPQTSLNLHGNLADLNERFIVTLRPRRIQKSKRFFRGCRAARSFCLRLMVPVAKVLSSQRLL